MMTVPDFSFAPRTSSALLLIAPVLLAACHPGTGTKDSTKAVTQSGERPDSSTSPLPVVVDLATDGDLVISILTKGEVRSESESPIRFETPGTIERVFVHPGQPVRKGDALATLDSVPFVLALKKTELAVEEAKQRYEDLLVDATALGRVPATERKQNALLRSGLSRANLDLDQARLDRKRATLIAPTRRPLTDQRYGTS
jgi:multidrug efflux pump subunit AcrA (membrane-fusion protein)